MAWVEGRVVSAYRVLGPSIITHGIDLGSAFGGWFCRNLQRVLCNDQSVFWQSALQ